MGGLKSKVVRGAVWQLCERIFGQFASFAVTLVLSRLITPADYGTVALLTIFLGLSSTLVDCGLSMALVQKKDVTDLHYNSMFYANLCVSLFLYATLYAVSPFVASFYRVPSIKWIMRVASLMVVFGAISSVHGAVLSRELLFDLRFRISLITTLVSAVVGIVVAIMGGGPWALVLQGVSSSFVGTIARWYLITWRPKLRFSIRALKELFGFGWKISAMLFLNDLTNNIFGLLIGKHYSREDLAFVNKGSSLPTILMSSITGTIIGVSFPALSRMQDSRDRIREGMSKMLQCATFLVFPLMIGSCVCAHDITLLLFGPQWLPAVVYMQIICIKVAMTPACDVNGQGIAAVGRSDLFIPLQLIKSALFFVVLLIALYFGVFYFVLLQCCFCKVIEYVINTWPNRRIFNYPIERQLKEMAPAALACAIMAGSVVSVRWFLCHTFFSLDTIPHLIVRVVVQGVVGLFVYVLVSSWLRVCAFAEYVQLLAPMIDRMCPSAGKMLRGLVRS